MRDPSGFCAVLRPLNTIKLPERRPPQLLALVYTISLLLVAGTGLVLTTVVGDGIFKTAVSSSIAADSALVTAFVEADLRPDEMTGKLAPDRQAELQKVITSLASSGIARITMYRPDGTVILANKVELIGQKFEVHPDLVKALQGEANGDVLSDPSAEPDLTALGIPVLLEEYLPVMVGGQVRAVFEVYRDAAPILAQASAIRNQVLGLTLGSSSLLAVLLYFVFRSADGRLKRQTRQLMEARRRDALTGMLNHGAVVDELSLQLDEAAPEERRLALALVDVDNLRLLNATHGHPAGDAVLRDVANILREELPSSTIVGRYGPDEFLCILPQSLVHAWRPRPNAPASTSSRDWSSPSTPRTATRSGIPRTWPATRCSWPTRWASLPSGAARCTSPGCCTTSARSASRTRSCGSPRP